MVCISCGDETNVVNSRPSPTTPKVWRRRKCASCNLIFSSREKPDFSLALRVRKQAGHYEPFSEDKLFISIVGSISHRNGPVEDARQLTDTVLSRILPCKSDYIKCEDIIAAAIQVLRRFDRAGATYYQAHHPIS